MDYRSIAGRPGVLLLGAGAALSFFSALLLLSGKEWAVFVHALALALIVAGVYRHMKAPTEE